MRFRRGVGDVAGHLRLGDAAGAEAERRGIGVAGLRLKARQVDGAAIEARRRAGLEAAVAEAERLEVFAEQHGGGFAAASGGIGLLAAVDEAVEERSGGDDDGAGANRASVAQAQALDAAARARAALRRSLECDQLCVCNQELGHLGLLDLEVGLGLEHRAHLEAVGLLVALGAGRPDGGAARGVEQTELDADGVGDFGHDAAEGVDLAHDVSLGDAADGGIAGHLRDEVGVEGEQGGAQSHARGGHGGFTAGMSGSNYGNVVMFGESWHALWNDSSNVQEERPS